MPGRSNVQNEDYVEIQSKGYWSPVGGKRRSVERGKEVFPF
jgi:hypothetical protein